eukprot:TRINITY_DN12225_c0_g3_i4.p2 TRINITY_DN12225_c0_g3~~TRINITY_DN12225_c0_g3_i4.p2  ORF type:complete len:110 (+),score=24.63 TRINITY_DN12225_c0_g3_i4:58-387(+)
MLVFRLFVNIFNLFIFFFFNDTATTEIYTRSIVGSVRCVQETVSTQSTWDKKKWRKQSKYLFLQKESKKKRAISIMRLSQNQRVFQLAAKRSLLGKNTIFFLLGCFGTI